MLAFLRRKKSHLMASVIHHRAGQQCPIATARSETSTCSKHGSGRTSQVPASQRATRGDTPSHRPQRSLLRCLVCLMVSCKTVDACECRRLTRYTDQDYDATADAHRESEALYSRRSFNTGLLSF